MTRIKNNPILKGISGILGDTVVYREVRGKMHIAKPPKTKDVKGPQTKFVKRFKRAVKYAKSKMKDPTLKAMYQEGVGGKKFTPYLVALSDYLTKPTIEEVRTRQYLGRIGDVITIDAEDDFKVVNVDVVLYRPNGAELERGVAVQDENNSELWHYTAKTQNDELQGTTISIEVSDLPGNKTELEMKLGSAKV